MYGPSAGKLRRGFRQPAGILRADHDVQRLSFPVKAEGDRLPVQKAGFGVDRYVRLIPPE